MDVLGLVDRSLCVGAERYRKDASDAFVSRRAEARAATPASLQKPVRLRLRQTKPSRRPSVSTTASRRWLDSRSR